MDKETGMSFWKNEKLSAPEGPDSGSRVQPTAAEVPDEEVDHARGGDKGMALTGPPPQAPRGPIVPKTPSGILRADGGAIHGGALGDEEEPAVGLVDIQGKPVQQYTPDELDDARDSRPQGGIHPPAPGERVCL